METAKVPGVHGFVWPIHVDLQKTSAGRVMISGLMSVAVEVKEMKLPLLSTTGSKECPMPPLVSEVFAEIKDTTPMVAGVEESEMAAVLYFVGSLTEVAVAVTTGGVGRVPGAM